MLNILVLCTGNSCRSIMAEAAINHFASDKFMAYSAGSKPTGEVHPLSIETLKGQGINFDGCFSKSWDEFIGKPIDIVITVCDSAAQEACPNFPGSPMKVHWGVTDPAKFQGNESEIEAEFLRVYKILERRIKDLVELDLTDKDDLEDKLKIIGMKYA